MPIPFSFALQELFDLAVLTFEDAWKAAAEQEGSPQGGAGAGGSQRLAQCYSKVFGCLNDIIHKVRFCPGGGMHSHR